VSNRSPGRCGPPLPTPPSSAPSDDTITTWPTPARIAAPMRAATASRSTDQKPVRLMA
jgi:hypothetical protein